MEWYAECRLEVSEAHEEYEMRDVVWVVLGLLLFLVWGISYIVFHVASVFVHVLLVLALVSVTLTSLSGNALSLGRMRIEIA